MGSEYSRSSRTPMSGRTHRKPRVVSSDDEASGHSPDPQSFYGHATPAISVSSGPSNAHMYSVELEPVSNMPLAVQKLAAELEVAEAELKASRLKLQYIDALEQAQQAEEEALVQAEDEAVYGDGDGEHETYE